MKAQVESIAYFLSTYGPAKSYAPVPPARLAAYKKSVPPFLLQIWKSEGLSHYAKGFFWWVDPEAYAPLLKRTLPKLKSGVVVMRTGLGGLVVFDEKKALRDKVLFFNPINEVLTPMTSSLSVVLNGWFTDEVAFPALSMHPLYVAAFKRLGMPKADECYAPKLPAAAGGDVTAATLVKKKIEVMYSL